MTKQLDGFIKKLQGTEYLQCKIANTSIMKMQNTKIITGDFLIYKKDTNWKNKIKPQSVVIKDENGIDIEKTLPIPDTIIEPIMIEQRLPFEFNISDYPEFSTEELSKSGNNILKQIYISAKKRYSMLQDWKDCELDA